MSKKSKASHLAEVKNALADKYERLAQTRRSKPGKARLQRQAEKFRSQARSAQSEARA